jgi:chromosome segregation ATPase
MEVREQFDEYKAKNMVEINKLNGVIQDLKLGGVRNNILNNFNDNNQAEEDDDNVSMNSDQQRDLLGRYSDLKDNYDLITRDYEEKEKRLIYEKEKAKKELNDQESYYKATLSEYESEILRLKTEISDAEAIRLQQEKEIMNDENKENNYYSEIENLQAQIRHVEDMKERSDVRHKEQISQLQEELKELDSTNQTLKSEKKELESQLIQIKSKSNKESKEGQEKMKADLIYKEKENSQLKERIELLVRENEHLKKEYELMRKNNEKSKNDFKDLNESLKKLRENSENEVKKWEDKFSSLEKRMENEKVFLEEQNKELKDKLSKMQQQNNFVAPRTSLREEEKLSSLEFALETETNEEGTVTNRDRILELEDEVTLLNSKISELEIKLKNTPKTPIVNNEKLNQELEILRKENLKLKADIKQMNIMYEKTITELEERASKLSSELQMNKRKTTSIRNSIAGGLNPKQMAILAELEVTIKRITSENKFLQDKIQIAESHCEEMKILKENDIKFLQEELRSTEQQAITAKVALATMAFEKDSELIKYKNMYKKLRMKVQGVIQPNNTGKGPVKK